MKPLPYVPCKPSHADIEQALSEIDAHSTEIRRAPAQLWTQAERTELVMLGERKTTIVWMLHGSGT